MLSDATATFEDTNAGQKAKKKFKRQTVREKFRENIRKKIHSNKKVATKNHEPYQQNGYEKKYVQVVRQILKISKRLRITEETCYLAICYYEQYLSSDQRKYLPKKFGEKISDSSLLATVLLFLSCKLNDVELPGTDELAGQHGKHFAKDIIHGEGLVFEKIDFAYIEESPYILFQKYFSTNRKFVRKCCNIFQKCVLKSWSLLYGWDMITRAIIYTLDSDIISLVDPCQRIQIKNLSGQIKQMERQIYL